MYKRVLTKFINVLYKFEYINQGDMLPIALHKEFLVEKYAR